MQDKNKPTISIIMTAFKRNYLISSFKPFSKQTYKPKFYTIIQNENRINYSITLFRKIDNEPIYQIWINNWNSFFF